MLARFSVCGCARGGMPKRARKLPSRPAPSFPGISLKVGAIDDAAILAGVAPQRGEWEASRHGDIAIRDEPVTLESLTDVDVVLFPAQRLGDLVDAGVLAAIPNAARSASQAGRRSKRGTDGRSAGSGRRPLWTTRFSTWTSRRPFASRSAATAPSGSRCRAGARPWCWSIAAMPSRAHPTARRRGRRG